MKGSYEYAGKKRFIAMFVLVVILASTLLFSCFIIKETGHDCTDVDCPICAMIKQCEDNLRLIGSGKIEIVIVASLVVFYCFFGVAYYAEATGSAESLVTWKIRFNN